MSLTTELLKAPHVGVRELRNRLSEFLLKDKPVVVTKHGAPQKVILAYSDMLALTDLIDELADPVALQAVLEGRTAIRSGAIGIPVSDLLSPRTQ